jgi:dTDP-glucose 4,6-dehydratase
MRIIVTGGAGFIGSCVVRKAIAEGYAVLNIDALTYAASLDNIASVSSSQKYHFEKIDICNYDKLYKTIDSFQPDSIIHLAAESHVDRSIGSASKVLETNIIGTFNLLDIFTKYWRSKNKPNSHRFIHISTDEVFGEARNSELFTENTRYDPKNPYSASKASSDHLVRAWINTHDIPAIITNCSNNYGPYQFPEKLIPLTINAIRNSKTIPIYGDGLQIRDWIYVDDHVSGLMKVLKDGIIGESYNIGSNNEVTNIDLVRMICINLDKKLKNTKTFTNLIKFVKDRPGHDKRYAIDSTKIRSQLNWTPEHNIESGLNKTIDWYLSNEDWLDKLSQKAIVKNRFSS